MTAAPDPIDAVITFLEDDADVAAGAPSRIVGSKLTAAIVDGMPQKAVMVLLAGGSGTDDGYLAFGRIRVDVRTYGATDAEARALHLIVHRALKNLRRQVVAGVLLHSASRIGGPIGQRDPATDWPFVLATYQVGYGEVAAS